MIPAFALMGILAAGQQVNEPNITPSQEATDAPVVTCEAKNPDPSSSVRYGPVEGVDLAA